MTGDLQRLFAQIAGYWRRDRALLLPVSLLFVFLPQYAVLLLVPQMPVTDPGASMDAMAAALEPWVARYGGWYVAATVMAQFGALATVSLYAPPVPAVGGAIGRALRRFPRALLAALVVTMPCAALALIALSVPLLPLLAFPGILYVLARTCLANPVILAEPGTGAVAAVARSWQLTRGRGMTLALVVGGIMVAGQVIGAGVVALDRGMRVGALANPVVLAAVDAVAAGVAWGAALALALVQVAVYRRLAR